MQLPDVFDKIELYSPTFGVLGRITNPVSFDLVLKANALSVFTCVVLADDPVTQWVQRPGCRIVISYRGLVEFSGMVDEEAGVILKGGTATFTFNSDWRMLQDTLAWVNPSNTLAPTSLSGSDRAAVGQAWITDTSEADGTVTGQYGYYLWPDGSTAAGGVSWSTAEACVKGLIGANFARIPTIRPVTIVPTGGRGGDARAAGVLPDLRFDTLEQGVLPILAWSGLVLDMHQEVGADRITLDVRVPSVYPAALTVESKVVQSGDYTRKGLKATRAIVGGPGDGAARAYIQSLDTTGLEALYGYGAEAFRDASSATVTWPSSLASTYQNAKYFQLRAEPTAADKAVLAAALTAAGVAGIAEGAPTTSVSAKLVENQAFHYGGTDGIRLGDTATVRTEGGADFQNTITEADISLSTSGELTVTPVLGTITDNATRVLADAIASIARSNRRISTSR